MANNRPTDPAFFRLPPELRLTIFELAYPSRPIKVSREPGSTISLYDRRDEHGLPESHTSNASHFDRTPTMDSRSPCLQMIVSRQWYTEASSAFISQCEWSIKEHKSLASYKILPNVSRHMHRVRFDAVMEGIYESCSVPLLVALPQLTHLTLAVRYCSTPRCQVVTLGDVAMQELESHTLYQPWHSLADRIGCSSALRELSMCRDVVLRPKHEPGRTHWSHNLGVLRDMVWKRCLEARAADES
jgi:hypothetical protein